jgi:hypothetical protein
MKASKKSAYWSSRHIAPTVLRAWHCAGAKVVRKKTVEIRFLADVEKLRKRIAAAQLRTPARIYEAIGRLKERYPRVARYYELGYDEQKAEFLLAGARATQTKSRSSRWQLPAKEQPRRPERRRHLAHLHPIDAG